MSKRLPTYSLHKATGQARVWLNGKDHYLGEYGSPQSHIRFGELVKQHVTGVSVNPLAERGPQDSGPTVNEITNAFLKFAETHYVKNGVQTAEVDCIKSAMTPLVDLFGGLPAKAFGPVALKVVRQRMVDGGTWCRGYINKSVGRIRRIFRHAVENELISPNVLVGLNAVAPLLAGRTTAKDHSPRKSIPRDQLDAVRAAVSEETRDMIDLAILTGARPGELVSLTTGMIDRTADVWVASLADHKNVHHGKSRVLVFGPRAQLILTKYLRRNQSEKLFPIKRATFSNRLKLACDTLKVPRFTGHWLRHTAATGIRKSHGLDGAQTIMGHASANMTEVYAHLEIEEASEIAREIG